MNFFSNNFLIFCSTVFLTAGQMLAYVPKLHEANTLAHCDDFGSVVALTDTSGTVLHTALYGPHGEDWGTTGVNPTPFTWLGGYGVQTLNTTTPLRLFLTRHRIYSATLNRFLSSDPLGLAGGLNLYAYAEGNPLAYMDPLGLKSYSFANEIDWGNALTRVGGGAKMIGGALESAAGFTFAAGTATTGVGAVAGSAVGLHGVDVAISGARTMWYGEQKDSLTSQGLQAAGVPQGWANGIDTSISVLGTAGVGIATKMAQAAPKTLYHYTSSEAAESIVQNGLNSSSGLNYVTPNGALTPSQAQTMLSLNPSRAAPNALLKIDAAALQKAGIKPIAGPQSVAPLPSLPGTGGGIEIIYNQSISPQFITPVKYP